MAEDEAETEVSMALWGVAIAELEREYPRHFAIWYECAHGDATPASLAHRLGGDAATIRRICEETERALLYAQERMGRLAADVRGGRHSATRG